MAKIEFIEIDDIRMPVTSFGNGDRTMLVLPGLYVVDLYKSADAIEEAFVPFFPDFSFYVMDRNQNITADYSVRQMADDTALVLDKLGVEDAQVFGASMGGMIALYLAAYHPDKVSRMVIASSVARTDEKADALFDEWIRLANAHDREGLAISFADFLSSNASRDIFRKVISEATAASTDEDLKHFALQCGCCKDMDIFDDLKRIKCPTLAIGCLGDSVLGCDGTMEIAQVLDCEVYMYNGRFGHAVYDEAPDFRQRLADFFV